MRAFVASRMFKSSPVQGLPIPVALANSEQGIAGVLFVFTSKTAARKLLGRNVPLQEIDIEEPGKDKANG